MAVSASLKRLLRVRTLEEEMSRQTLEAAMAELRRLEAAIEAAAASQRAGRRRIASSASNGELADRLAGIEQQRSAEAQGKVLEPWRQEAAEEAEVRREDLLTRRVEMRQAETLVKEAEARAAAEADRRAQLTLDDWFGARLHREALEEDAQENEPVRSEMRQPYRAEPSADLEKT
jgi:flagellar biosynthesis chaperone FliJ